MRALAENVASTTNSPASDPYAQQKSELSRSIADATQHRLMLAQQQQTLAAIGKLHPLWLKLPRGPYPPTGDTTGFPRTGDPSLILDPSSISAAQLAEPGKLTSSLLRQSLARRPKLTPLFWIGLACLGAGLVLKNR